MTFQHQMLSSDLHHPRGVKSKKASRSKKNKDHLSSTQKMSKEDIVKVDAHDIDESTASTQKKKSKVSTVDGSVKVAQISSMQNCSKGMKKWMNEYSESRQNLRKLQQDIDEFMAEHEALKQKEKEEKNAELIKDGFQPVEHHKGRKKTTDSETGITVGSVSQAAMIHNITKKKKNEIPLDFYRFQKREARRSEIMTLQSKFEHDKKRIQQLRAARKFRPY